MNSRHNISTLISRILILLALLCTLPSHAEQSVFTTTIDAHTVTDSPETITMLYYSVAGVTKADNNTTGDGEKIQFRLNLSVTASLSSAIKVGGNNTE